MTPRGIANCKTRAEKLSPLIGMPADEICAKWVSGYVLCTKGHGWQKRYLRSCIVCKREGWKKASLKWKSIHMCKCGHTKDNHSKIGMCVATEECECDSFRHRKPNKHKAI